MAEPDFPFTANQFGYGPQGIPVEIAGTTKGRTQCDLHIPHKTVGRDIAAILGEIEGVDPRLKAQLTEAFTRLDENWQALEQWQHHFWRNCVCHCQESGT